MKLATGIVVVYGRSASIHAMTAATLDHVSGGRAILGLGIGHKQVVPAQHGVPFDRPLGRIREHVETVRALVRGDGARAASTSSPSAPTCRSTSPPSARRCAGWPARSPTACSSTG